MHSGKLWEVESFLILFEIHFEAFVGCFLISPKLGK